MSVIVRYHALVAGPLYEHSAAEAKLLGRRAVLIVGKNPRNRLPALPEGVVACDYAPFSELFPRTAVLVHPGGIGTTGLAMRSGRAMLVRTLLARPPGQRRACGPAGHCRRQDSGGAERRRPKDS